MEKKSRMYVMIYCKKNAGKWVASKGKRVIATDVTLENILQKVKKYKKSDIRLDLVPPTPYIIGAAAF